MTKDTISPQIGKRYRMRNGVVTGLVILDQEQNAKSTVYETAEKVDGLFAMWGSDGRAEFFGGGGILANRPYDLVEEVE